MGKRKKGKGRATKKLRGPTGIDVKEEQLKKAPHTFIIHRGQVGKSIQELERDLRRVMEPFTASKLKVRKKNVLKDFVSMAGPLNVTHLMVLSRSELNVQLRLVRLPRGPTLTFRVNSYSLSKDVISSIKHHIMEPKQFQHHPLLVMNNFSGDGMHLKLMSTMFQNMLPSINVSKVKLGEIRRCVLLHYNPDDQTVEYRHYNIRAVPVGMSKGVKKLVKSKIPNLSRFDDVSDFLLRGGDLSESEAELDGDLNEVVLPQDMAGRGNVKSAKSAIRLTEIGPRMKLQLIKIEDGIAEGEVLYHQFVTKTEEEISALKKKIHKKKQAKALRKKEQEHNVEKKLVKKQELKEKSLAGMAAAKQDTQDDSSKPESADEDDDAEYFRQEVGHEPDKELFPSKKGGKKRPLSQDRSNLPIKKKRTNKAEDRSHSALMKKRYKNVTNTNSKPVGGARKFDNTKQNRQNKNNTSKKGSTFKPKMKRPQGKRKR